MLHDIAKEMDKEQEDALMKEFFNAYIDKPRAIYHQWLSTYQSQQYPLLAFHLILLQLFLTYSFKSPLQYT